MKKLSTIFLPAILLFFSSGIKADIVYRMPSNTAIPSATKSAIERNVSTLLTQIDLAGRSGADLNLSGVGMQEAAKKRLQDKWEYSPFICSTDGTDMYVQNCVQDMQGYQVRNLRVRVKPKNQYEGSLNQAIMISVNKQGQITGVNIMQANESYADLIDFAGVTDERMRMEVLKWVEDYKNYYIEKNMPALELIYSDDAIIITGSVQQRRSSKESGNFRPNKVNYTIKNKKEYLTNLKRIFQRNRRIDVKFTDISVMRHPKNPDIYAVTLKQSWTTDSYHDDGWLFLIWNFKDEDHPEIYVREWIDGSAPEGDLPTIFDFKLGG